MLSASRVCDLRIKQWAARNREHETTSPLPKFKAANFRIEKPAEQRLKEALHQRR